MITEERLKELGFKLDYKAEKLVNGKYVPDDECYRYEKGAVIVRREGDKQYVNIHSSMTSAIDYAHRAFGVKTEEDLITLCRLVNGD